MSKIDQILGLLKKDPNNIFLNYVLALEYVAQGSSKNADQCFKKVLDLDSNYLAVYYQYGKLKENLGELQLAKDLYSKGCVIAKKKGDQKTFQELKTAQLLLIE